MKEHHKLMQIEGVQLAVKYAVLVESTTEFAAPNIQKKVVETTIEIIGILHCGIDIQNVLSIYVLNEIEETLLKEHINDQNI